MRHTVFFAGMLVSVTGVFATGCADPTKDCKLNPALPCFWDEHGGGAGGEAGAGGGVDPGILIPPETVYVTDSYGEALPNIPVVVNDESGAIVLEVETGLDGAATVDVPPGGSVSVFQSQGDLLSVNTIVDPPSGSAMRVPRHSPNTKPAAPEKVTPYNVGFKDVPAGTYIVYVALDGACDLRPSWPDDTVMLTDERCANPSFHNLLAVAFDMNDHVLGWGKMPVGTQPGYTAAVTISLSETSLATTEIQLAGIPAKATSAGLSGDLDGWPLLKTFWPPIIEGKASTSVAIPNVSGVERALSVSLGASNDLTSSRTWMRRRYSADALPANAVFDASTVPWVSAMPADMSVPEHPVFAWSAEGTAAADYAYIWCEWQVGTGGVGHLVLLPPQHPRAWRMPDIPDSLSSYRPDETTVMHLVEVSYREQESLNGYADAVDGTPDDLGAMMVEARGRVLAPQ